MPPLLWGKMPGVQPCRAPRCGGQSFYEYSPGKYNACSIECLVAQGCTGAPLERVVQHLKTFGRAARVKATDP